MGLAILLSLMQKLCPQTLPYLSMRHSAGEGGVELSVGSSSASLLGILVAGNHEIQCQFESYQGGGERLEVVDIPGPESTNTIPNSVSNTKHNNRVRCLQQGVGNLTGQNEHWGKVVAGGIFTPHKLPGSLPSIAELYKTQQQYDNSDENGQCHSSDIHQQARRDTLSLVVSIGLDNMGVESAEEYFPNSRTPPREGECCSRSRIKSDERLLQLDAKSPSIQSSTTDNGPLQL